MSYNKIAIQVKNVSKNYLIFKQPQDRLKQMILPKLQRATFIKPKKYYTDFTATKDINFEVKRGETVGIIGRNGSGKSTLLQLICGIIHPSQGSIILKGRVAALLELGAGFNTEFTGRENVYMNAAILGATRKEIDERFDSIVNFADIGEFIEQPVKTYSSGMFVRLAFAVAINVDPDILIVDEALSVGDEAFQRKCFARIEQIQERGGTILFVSHSAGSIVQLCSRAMLIDRGEIVLEGRPKTVINQYQRFMNLSGNEAELVREELKNLDGWARSDIVPEEITQESLLKNVGLVESYNDESSYDPNLISDSRVEYESKGATIRDVRVTTVDGRRVNILESGNRYFYQYTVEFSKSTKKIGFGMMIKTVHGFEIGGAATDFEKKYSLEEAKSGSRYTVKFDLKWSLNAGTYFLNAGVTGEIEGHKGAYSHRLLDACAIKILPTEVHTSTGIVDFQVKPSYNLITEDIISEIN